MRVDLAQPGRPKLPTIHYGWVILGAGTFGSFMTLPGQTAGVSVFFDPITSELGISRTSASIAYAAGTLAGILPAPAIGRWIDRLGPRPTATIIAGALALACAYMASVQSALMLLIGFAFLRGAAIGGLSLVSQQVVNLWFVRRRGIAAAAASLGLAAGSMGFPAINRFPHISVRLERRLFALAGFVALTILPVVALLFRDRPEKFGLSPDAGLALTAKDTRPEPSFSRQQALRTGVFWLLCAAGFLTNAVGTALLLNHFSIMQTAGVAYVDALTLLALVGGVQATATIGTGFLVDRYEPRRLVPLAMGMLALALRSAGVQWGRRRELALRVEPGWRIRLAASDQRRRLRTVFWPRSSRRNQGNFVRIRRCGRCVRAASVRCKRRLDGKLRRGSGGLLRTCPYVRGGSVRRQLPVSDGK